MMRKRLATLAMMAAVAFPLAAQADGIDYPGTFFVNGGLGQSQYRLGGFDDHRDAAAIIGFGYRWNHIFGIEAGYTDLGTARRHAAQGARSLSVKGWTLGMNGRFVIHGPWSLAARAGVFRARSAATSVLDARHVHDGSSGDGYYVGVGADYDVRENFSLGARYDLYRNGDAHDGPRQATIGVYGVNAEYRF